MFLFVFLTFQFAREEEKIKLKKKRLLISWNNWRDIVFFTNGVKQFVCPVVLFAFIVLILLFCCALLHWEKVLDSSAFFSHRWVLACHHKCNYKKYYKKCLHGIKLQLFHILHGMGKSVSGFTWAFLFVCLFSSPLTLEAICITFLG